MHDIPARSRRFMPVLMARASTAAVAADPYATARSSGGSIFHFCRHAMAGQRAA